MVIMELKGAVPNPAFDGRKRSGWQSVREFGKGQRFALLGSAGGLEVRFIDTQDVGDDPRLVTALLAQSAPASARNFRELAITLPDGVTPETVLDRLLADGRLTEQDIRAAAVAGNQT
jgi:hypothetical protein